MRFAISLAYNGTRFKGWQKQPNAFTVQAHLEEALSKLSRQDISVTGCGRTDAGVHAEQYFAHFDAERPVANWVYKLNRLLNDDVLIRDIRTVPPDWHARYSALSRSYIYRIKRDKDPFRKEWFTIYPQMNDLDFDRMQQVARMLPDYEDFYTFAKAGSDARTTICKLEHAVWEFLPEKGEMYFRITADRFLWGMVRLIVGMSLRVGRGLISPDEVREAMEQKRRLKKPWRAPARGLSLVRCSYPD